MPADPLGSSGVWGNFGHLVLHREASEAPSRCLPPGGKIPSAPWSSLRRPNPDFGNLKAIWGENPTTGWKETHDRVETRLRQLKMKNRFFKKNFPILLKKLKLLRKVTVFAALCDIFFENLIIRGSV